VTKPNVQAEVDETMIENDNGIMVAGLIVTCSKCGHEVEVFGRHERSIKRGAVMLNEECPEGEDNWYVTDEEGEEYA
jgi:hypothetical protein